MTELDKMFDEMKTRSPRPKPAEELEFSDRLGKLIMPYSHSPWPAWSLSTLFLGTSAIGMRNPALPPFILRFGFGLIFTGAGYMISTGDVENGSATAASWTGSWFLVNELRKEIKKIKGEPITKLRIWQHSPLALGLNTVTFITMTLYGSEYFWFKNFRPQKSTSDIQ